MRFCVLLLLKINLLVDFYAAEHKRSVMTEKLYPSLVVLVLIMEIVLFMSMPRFFWLVDIRCVARVESKTPIAQ